MALVDNPRTLANERERRSESLREGYIPPDVPVVDPSVVYHEEIDQDLDPVTYEVLRSKLWNLNLDHGDTIRRTSGSNIVVEGLDFNCAITTEIGDAVTSSPYSMFFAGFADEVIKWTLEHRSMNVGIRDGDLFLQDDPWVGSNHQMDTAVYGPVFVENKLFGWLFNCLHQREIGGLLPGGFVLDANDVWAEPSFMPPIKLAENDVVREDVVDMWTRRSRLPDLMALELNSQVSGFRTAHQRLMEIIGRYGAPAVRAAMVRMIDDTARITGERLARLPDGEWRDERYVAGATPVDTSLHRWCLSYRKTGDRLTVSNEGTDPASGAFNISRGVFRASVLNGLLPIIAYDQYLCAAGVLRQIDFEYSHGAITSAPHPSAVSSSQGSVGTINQAHLLAAKMVSGDPELAGHAFASSGLHTLGGGPGLVWRDEHGNFGSDTTLDLLAGGVGAFNHRDGIDYGGSVLCINHHFSDVERFEQVMPCLYLYRREATDSGGHGRWRGGVTFSIGFMGHKAPYCTATVGGLAKSITGGLGMGGGWPATGGNYWYAEGTDVPAWFADGRMPGGPDELRAAAPTGDTATRGSGYPFSSNDVFELLPNPGAGWGDPLDREIALVAADVANGRLSVEDAVVVYGAKLDDNGQVDVEASAENRSRVRAERLESARPPRAPTGGTSDTSGAIQAIEGVAVVGSMLACGSCGQHLGSATDGYRLGCAELDIPLASISDHFVSPEKECGEAVVFRRFLCPACGTALDSQICRPTDDPFCDLRLTK
ncbi:MAG: hydantoinase B/oxoprolinase family protein [bacterium]|nr:hydantoinase B/oxoprolinase family protein [bacterium]